MELATPGVSSISPGSSGTSAALSAMSAPLSARSLTSERFAGDMMGASSFSMPAPLNGLFSMSNIDLDGAADEDDEDDWDSGGSGGGCCCCDLWWCTMGWMGGSGCACAEGIVGSCG